jgi:hypothetical protein
MEKKATEVSETVPSIGDLIARYFTERRTFKSSLSRLMGVRPQTVYAYRAKTSMQTDTIWKLCLILKHNFLKDLADQLPKDFSSFSPKDDSLFERIATLEKENELLKAQLAVLKEVMGK